jgi:hypothetical protein
LQDDLSQYSTTIDMAKLPEKQRKKAERGAKEIELRQCCRGWDGKMKPGMWVTWGSEKNHVVKHGKS